MSEPEIKHILCAVRSRPGGEETVRRAVELARQAGARLTFLQVIDVTFVGQLSHRSSSRKAAIQELTEMASFTLGLLCEQARRAGVGQADFVVREGAVREQLIEAVRDLEPDVLVFGRPQEDSRSTFRGEERARFVTDVEAATGVRVL
jgi:nucleotide-binding universal stress UspA family protein